MNLQPTRLAPSRAMSLALFCVALATFLIPAVCLAEVVSFDPDGSVATNPGLPVATFDLLPGNSVFKNLGSIVTPKVNQPTTHYIQTRLGTLLDVNSAVLPALGLNSDFEITLAAGFDALASTGALPNTGFSTTYTLAPEPQVAFFRLYFDNNPLTKANDLTGTGFDDGQLILSGTIISANGGFFQFGGTTPPLPNLDSFGVNDYPGQTSYHVAGGEDLDVAVDSYDPNFFLLSNSILSIALFNSSDIAPFQQANPSSLFLPHLANYAPTLGPINGAGADFQTQADANSSFTLAQGGDTPEPSSIVLLGVGLVGLAGHTWRRRRAAR